MEYIAYLHKDRDSDYGVSFPIFRDASPPERLSMKRAGWRRRRWRSISRA